MPYFAHPAGIGQPSLVQPRGVSGAPSHRLPELTDGCEALSVVRHDIPRQNREGGKKKCVVVRKVPYILYGTTFNAKMTVLYTFIGLLQLLASVEQSPPNFVGVPHQPLRPGGLENRLHQQGPRLQSS